MRHEVRGASEEAVPVPSVHPPAVHDQDHKPPYKHSDLAHHAPADPSALLPYVDHDHVHAPDVAAQQDAIRKQKNDAMAVSIGFQLAALSRGMSDSNSRAFINTLDKIDDPDLRHKVMAQFEAQTGQSLRSFIEHCQDWNNNGENRDKAAALQLIDDKRDKAEEAIAAMAPEVRAKKEQEANDYAIQILSATTAHDHSDENMQKIFRALGARDPVEIEMIRAAVRRHTHGESNLYQAIDDGTHEGDEDEAIAMLAGDKVGSARAALANETDPKRLRDVINGLDDQQRAQLNFNVPFKSAALARIKNPADRGEIAALIENNKARADGEHLANLLKPKGEGMDGAFDKIGLENFERRKPANVLKEFEGMSGEDVKAAAEQWNRDHPERTFEKMLEDRWGDDDDKTEYNRLLAMIHGDKGLDRSLRVQEGMRKNDQEEIEGALAHQNTDDKALQSTDDKVRNQAEAIRAENESFERNNIELDRAKQQTANIMSGRPNEPVAGRSTHDQLVAHYDADKAKDIGSSWQEDTLGGDAAKQIHAQRQTEHDQKSLDNRVGAMELLDDGKLSPETEVHRGKGAKEQAEALENIQSNADLAKAAERYQQKYGKEMLPYTGKSRSDMNANELMIENIRLYGVKAERPAQVEYLLQLQQYELQYSSSLELSESSDAGGGTQRWQRQELAAERDMLQDPKLQAFDPKVVKNEFSPLPLLAENPNEPTFDQIDKLLPMKGENVEDGLKDGVTKQEFNLQDKGMTAANKAEEAAKKRLAERIVKILSTIAKIAAALTAQPELIALIDIGEGLLEMAVKHQVMGEAYDPSEDAKMLAFTAAADLALMGLSKVGKLKGAESLAQHEAISAGEKTALEVEHAATGEAKAQALNEGAHLAAGESKVMQGAVNEATSAEKALGSEAATAVGSKVEQKAANLADGAAIHEGESVAAKGVAQEAEQGTLGAAKQTASPEEIAKQIEARWGLAGAGAKMVIQTIGGGIVHHKSPSDILKSLVTGGLGLVLPAQLSQRVRAAIGNETAALKILGEIGATGTEFTTNMTLNAAGGAADGQAALDALIGVGGARLQKHFGGEPATAKEEEAGAPGAPIGESIPVHERITEPMPAQEPTIPGHERITEPMPAQEPSLPVHERATERMAAVEPAANEPQTIAERIDRATGVDKGPEHEQFRQDMAEFYANQEREAANVTRVSERHTDPAFNSADDVAWNSSYSAREFQYDNAVLTQLGIDVHLAPQMGVTPEQVAAIRDNTYAGVDRLYNFAPDGGHLHNLPNGNVLQVEPNFVGSAAGADVNVNVSHPFDPMTGDPMVTNMTNWVVDDVVPGGNLAENTAGHELGHVLGLPDEYVDPRFPSRATPSSPQVHQDGSAMGNYPQEGALPELKQRHLDQLGTSIDNAQRTQANAAATTQRMPAITEVPEGPKTRGTPEEQLSTRGAQDLTAEELTQAREAQEARNKYLKGAREPVPAGLSPETERLLTRSDNAIRDHMTPDDIAATLKEGRGVQITGPGGRVYDHITEVAQARTNVITSIEEIKARLQELNIAGGSQVEIDLLESKLSELSDFLDSLP